MRDLLLLTLLPYLIYACFKRPYLGLALWLWSSLVPVSVWGYGMATSIRWNFVFAVCTMLSFIISKEKSNFKFNGSIALIFIFFIHATISSIFNLGYEDHVWREWEYLLKSVVFGIFVLLIVKKRIHVNALMWACVLSISARAAVDGLKVIISGGGHNIYGISPSFNDNNLSALATLMCIPMMFYLYTEYKKYKYIKFGLIGLIITNVLMVIGSDSRGGLIGLLVLAGYFFIKSKNKASILIVLFILAGIGYSFVDQAWLDRMNTIKTADQDGSFMSRVVSWKLAIILALENPVFGGGFDAASYGPTWRYLVLLFDRVSFIPSPDPHIMHVAHSIYFQVLGDLGFVGLFIYLLLLYGTFSRFNQFKKLKSEQQFWLEDFGRFMTLSIVAFAVSGAALSAAYNEIFIMLISLSIVYRNIIIKLRG